MQVQLAYRCALVLRDLINPYLLRRQKKDVKEVNRMPSKTEQVLFCRLSSKQRSLYQEYLSSDEVMGVMRGSVQLLKAVTMLRKICNHPDLVVGPDGALDSAFQDESSTDEDNGDTMFDEDQLVERAGKLNVLSKILPLWQEQGHRVIIFCQWRKMLVRSAFVYYLYGTTLSPLKLCVYDVRALSNDSQDSKGGSLRGLMEILI